MENAIYDFTGVGLGPFNLGLACLARPVPELRSIFLDRNQGFNWHPGMLLENATLQTPFMGDLVTLADPTSPFTFLNYVKEQGKIYSFYTREDFFLLRNEYNLYCQWAAAKLDNLKFGHTVKDVRYDKAASTYKLTVADRLGGIKNIETRKLVVGTGTSPSVPACCKRLAQHMTHSSQYLTNKKQLQARQSIVIVGSGQSAAEIYYDLLSDIDNHDYSLDWVTRSPRFFPLDLTKLNLEMTSPEYARYFHNLPDDTRDRVLQEQSALFKGINASLLKDIYDLLYRKSLKGSVETNLIPNSELVDVRHSPGRQDFSLEFRQREQDITFTRQAGAVILATGYDYKEPEFLGGIAERLKRDSKGRLDVGANYAVDRAGNEVFVQNLDIHTHGFVAPDLGMACLRNATILREIAGYEVYAIEQETAFQTFDVRGLSEVPSARVVA
ncbi:lysine N(6)-hydroxylase/L-ornithine N(5)-oxygenase family protein [Agrobacterium rubi]|uniref:SidA/IucD/PvdA family monooxygenase n=1 Tax=Agrobacterium rubi TaxID=28099 RepID=A0AAE7R817_9HYPH|nr:SidA/IucD/PvdA family monooxygenase [Agrobacterium rubi]NTE87967.1 SidA/IucD/PvdA family monooxygenase [Agrobacterium rubi]NTF03734.1 SidA/IucD/PvdA family monooxygenase [Agrobacterium rubi]NTF38061.1 SidA/IucD/PvdA family monooxygenase [Agrobacterium rubi]OCJ43581.1 alcaligin biosynthesis protein [Agrobacterium rubi]QTG02023.1 SidA/IucD/PvdA family monooxygenase [Agrobacterium rubi]